MSITFSSARGLIILKLVLTLTLLLVSCDSAQVQTSEATSPGTLTLTGEREEYPLGTHIEILEDPSGELTIEDVSSPEFDSKFTPSHVDVPNYGFTDSVYWVRFDLENQTQDTEEWLLEQGFANTHYIDLYTPVPDSGSFTVKQTGVLRPISTRDFFYPRIVFILKILPGSQQTTYMRFQSGASMTLSLSLLTRDAFQVKAQTEQSLHGLFYGILIGLLIYNLVLFFISIREASSLYYVTFLASFAFFIGSYDGYTQIYFFTGLANLAQYYIPLSFAAMMVSIVLFANDFLEIKTQVPRIYRASIVILGVWGLFVFLTPFTNYHILTLLMVPWAVLTIVVILIAGIFSLQRGFYAARFFLFAWSGLLVTLFLVMMVRFGFIPSKIFSENGFRLAAVWMAVCWSIALADRINILKAEMDAANRDLQKSENLLSQILEGLPVGVVLYGKDHKPQYVNRRTTEILNDSTRDVQVDVSAGRTLEDAIQYFSLKMAGSDKKYPLENFPIFKALKGEPASADDIEADQGDRRVPLEVWASPIKDDLGNVASAVLAFQDITSRKQAELAQDISETRFRVIAENILDGIAFMARDREVLYVSPSYLRLVGKTYNELVGQSGIGLVHSEDRGYTAQKFNQALQSPNEKVLAEYRIPHKNGSSIWVETTAINMLENPHVQAVVLVSHNITDRKQRETELAEYRKQLEALVEQRTAELSVANEQLQLRIDWLSSINLVNQAMARSADFKQIYEKIIETINKLFAIHGSFIAELDEDGKTLKIFVHRCRSEIQPDLIGTSMTQLGINPLDGNIAQGKFDSLSCEQLNDLNGPIGVHIQGTNVQRLALIPLLLREKTFGILGLEILDKDKALTDDEMSLLDIFSNDIAQLIEVSHLFNQSRELIMSEERRRLARDLHDSVTQTLFVASVLAESTPRIWDKDQALARANMDKLSGLIRGALAEMRSLLLELRSSQLQNQTLPQLLTTLAEAGRVRTRADIAMSASGDPKLPDNVIINCYYIAREALNNAINHADPTQIKISLDADPHSLELRVQDDGAGFDPHDIPEGHLGINIMLNRAARIGANLRIISDPGLGSEVILNWSGKVE